MRPFIGYALREQNRRIVSDEAAINAVEITFERADDPLRVDRHLGDADFGYVSVHALKLSPGSPDPPARQYLEEIKSVVLENEASAVSDHLGFTRDSENGIELGHFAPLPPTLAALDVACRNVDHIQRYFHPLPFFLENIAYLFRLEGNLTEADFLNRLLRRTGCGWLLDVTNVYANSVNFQFDPYEFIAQVMPAASRVQMHLAGGFFDPTADRYIDSHSEPIPETVWHLYRYALHQAADKVDAVFIERDQNFPDDEGWREEIRNARRIAEEVSQERAGVVRV